MSSSTGKCYRIQESLLVGRQLLASRRIPAGEVIIDEPALLTGPGFAGGGGESCTTVDRINKNCLPPTSSSPSGNGTGSGDHHVCLVCCANLTSSERVLLQCPNCSLFLCSELCRSHPQHSQNECLVFPKLRHVWDQNRGRSKKSLYNLILTIRGLFFKFREPSKWDQIRMLESKSEALRKAGAFHELQDVFNCLSWSMFSSPSGGGRPPDHPEINGNEENVDDSIVEAAQHCLGAMRINAFSCFSESYSREGLFFLSSLMAHRCFINTDRQMESGGAGYLGPSNVTDNGGSRMVVRASVDIDKDEPITTTYLSLLYNTEERHRIMISSWLFMCRCERCEDPDEFLTFVAGVQCNYHNKIHSLIPANSVDSSSSVNQNCDCRHNAETTLIPQILKSRPKNIIDIQKLEDWLDQYDNGKLLHPNNSIFTHVKLFLCQYYGRQSGGVDQLSVSQLRRKILYCQQILDIYDRVAPGIQMCRGVILFELWNGLRKLQDLDQLPTTMSFTSENQHKCDEKYIAKVKMEALKILGYALPNSSEEAMSRILEQD